MNSRETTVNRSVAIVVLLFLSASFAWAQQKPPSQEELKKRKEKVLQEPFLKKAAWLTDYDKALAAAKKSGKPIFAYFTRSYAD